MPVVLGCSYHICKNMSFRLFKMPSTLGLLKISLRCFIVHRSWYLQKKSNKYFRIHVSTTHYLEKVSHDLHSFIWQPTKLITKFVSIISGTSLIPAAIIASVSWTWMHSNFQCKWLSLIGAGQRHSVAAWIILPLGGRKQSTIILCLSCYKCRIVSTTSCCQGWRRESPSPEWRVTSFSGSSHSCILHDFTFEIDF